MTRLLLISSILTTLVLFNSLADRPPILVSGNPEDEIDTVTGQEPVIDGFETRKDKPVIPWPQEMQAEAQAALDNWEIHESILPQLDVLNERSPQEERLRASWICKAFLKDTSGAINVSDSRTNKLRLESGETITFTDLKVKKGMTNLVLPGPVEIQIRVDQIAEIRVNSEPATINDHPGGSLSDTMSIMELLSAEGTIPAKRWTTWFENGGPETLTLLLPPDRSRLLRHSLQAIWGIDPIQDSEPVTGSQSAGELTRWMDGIRKKLRSGFPTEDREETLLTLESWKNWLDRNGKKAYRSERALQKIRQDLRLLQLDIVKSTGF